MHTFKGFLSEGDTSDATNAEMAICYQYNLMYNEGMTHEGALEKAGISSEKFKKGESDFKIVADIAGNWIVPGIGETYDAMEKNKLMKNIARPEELEALDKYNRYRSGQKMAEGAIELGEEEAAAQQMSENVNTPEEQLNLFKL